MNLRCLNSFFIAFVIFCVNSFSGCNNASHAMSDMLPLLRMEYFCDNFLLSRFVLDVQSLNSLIKYSNYALGSIEKELQVCHDFRGIIKEHFVYCPDRPLYTSCAEASTDGSGVYRLRSSKLNDIRKTFLIYCMDDDDDGDAWTVIQRRVGDDISFDRDFTEYENGFGNPYGSYWLGLKELYAMTNGIPHELWIQLEDFGENKTTKYIKYKEFAIGDEHRQYALMNLGEFEGTLENSLKTGSKFWGRGKGTVKEGFKPCSEIYNAGWWFPKKCGESNLNGIYFEDGVVPENNRGIYWESWLGKENSYQYAHMAIRQKISH